MQQAVRTKQGSASRHRRLLISSPPESDATSRQWGGKSYFHFCADVGVGLSLVSRLLELRVWARRLPEALVWLASGPRCCTQLTSAVTSPLFGHAWSVTQVRSLRENHFRSHVRALRELEVL